MASENGAHSLIGRTPWVTGESHEPGVRSPLDPHRSSSKLIWRSICQGLWKITSTGHGPPSGPFDPGFLLKNAYSSKIENFTRKWCPSFRTRTARQSFSKRRHRFNFDASSLSCPRSRFRAADKDPSYPVSVVPSTYRLEEDGKLFPHISEKPFWTFIRIVSHFEEGC